MRIRILIALFSGVLCLACVTHIGPSRGENPPPTEPFSAFSHFELNPLVADDSADEIHENAFDKIQENVNRDIGGLLRSWNAESHAWEAGRTLVLSPTIEQLKFVSGGTRFLAGAYAGSSAVVMSIRMVDKATGAEVANPEFFQRAAAMGGAYSLGATDNDMLARIARVAERYLRENYAKAVGGPVSGDSGKD